MNKVSPTTSLTHLRTLFQPAAIVDFAWYPGASRHNLPSYCFVASVRECPVKLLDARDGRLRASYRIVDHRERQIAPHSLAFNLAADKCVFYITKFLRAPSAPPHQRYNLGLYCGFEDAIEIFGIQRPGEGDRLHTTPSKKSKDGLKGIISTIAFSPSPDYYAAGSLTPASATSDNIALFNELSREPVLSIGGVADLESGGVVQLMFSPTQPHMLYASFRRSEKVWAWDLRGDASVPLFCLSSEGDSEKQARNLTNQKMRFDVDSGGRWLGVGDQLGRISIYGLENGDEGDLQWLGGDIREIRPTLEYEAHNDTIGAVVLHPLQPLLLSVSGSRHFDDDDDGDEGTPSSDGSQSNSDESDSDDEASDSGRAKVVVRRSRYRPLPSVRDASVKIWDFGKSGESGTRDI
ncbi:hypothetical protein HYDPIDRAFT_43937 [Hydnomerulius pinastri MD-312]|uniref:Ribosome biogenesis protein NSA1 n=1 Tax=Hydnomerulius pinastri MD-312 TaxID=994086 RepID=A0A0C9W163_9AGAM|nr:hypothetical protein HYDPIDRAFT_43937 [Hydnomerulius pinastri MD-312]